LRNCVAKNGTAGAGVNIAEYASNVTVENCEVSNFQRVPLDDSHGVIVQTTTKNVVVRNSKIHHNSGDAVQCIGPEGAATIAGTPHDNLLVENNTLHDNNENGVDVKTCTHVTLRGNTIYGHHTTSSSKGEGIVIHMSAKDVVVEDNVLRDNGRGISVGGNREGDPPTNIMLRRNQLTDGSTVNGDEGTAIRINTAWNVQVYNNTVYGMPANCLGFGSGDSGNTDRLDVRNNVFTGCTYAVKAGPLRSNVSLEANLYWRAGASVQLLDGSVKSLDAWKRSTGWDSASIERDPGFTNLAKRDLSLGASSPAREAGVSVGLPYCGPAPDQGALETGCSGATASIGTP
jgi:parallel beta-helix repeat protein